MSKCRCLQLVASLAAAALLCGVSAADGGLTTEQLVYQGAQVEVQVDVDGAVAIQFAGDALDALAELAQQQAEALAGAEGPPPGPVAAAAAAAPLIGPAKAAVESLSRVTLLVMTPQQPAAGAQVVDHYAALLTPRGWAPMVTVRAEQGEGVLVLVAPGGKGIFAVVAPKQEQGKLVVALVTTTRPVGELIGNIVRAGGGPAAQALMAQMVRPSPPKAASAGEPQGEAAD